MRKDIFLYLFLLLALPVLPVKAQQRLKFQVADFHRDPLALTARSGDYARDGYAIIKVTSDLADDDLRLFAFDFGLLNSTAELHDDVNELWVYVQKNAKRVTISREGYVTVKYDLPETVAAGSTYEMKLSVSGPQVYLQMVLFRIQPTTAKSVVMVKPERQDAVEELFGIVDENGAVAKSLPFGSYSYRVAAENFYPAEGRFTLNSQVENHVEEVTLRGNFGTITLQVASDADIYVDGEKRGTRSWTGTLKAGAHQVECRQVSHKPSTQSITVAEDETRTIALTPPTPITGTLSITSRPLGASIKIDGKDYGETPRNITGLIVGKHVVELESADHKGGKQEVEIIENQTTQVALELAQLNNYTTLNGDDREFTVTGNGKTITFKMIKVKAGTFQMGGTESDEKPVHNVTISKDFYMGETEVTQGLWYAVMGKIPSNRNTGDSFPVKNVNYKDCLEFLERLNKLVNQSFRLPTESEWEYAARGGHKMATPNYIYAGSNTLGDVAWYSDNSGSETHEVKTKKANELGLYDMSGNVRELCADWYGSYNSDSQTNPIGPTSGSYRVFRGGSWNYDATNCRVASRGYDSPSNRYDNLGFRLAL